MSKSLLSQGSRGRVEKPPLILVYGPDGVGKSSFAAGAESPAFLCAEGGADQFDNVWRAPPIAHWEMCLSLLHELLTEKHEHKTLVIDSLDWLEPMLYRNICAKYNVASIELAAGGYGKGYTEAFNQWVVFKDQLIKLRDKGMGIILIAHAEIVSFNDPNLQATYDRYQIKLHKKASALFREFVDTVLFANYASYTKKDGSSTRFFGDDARIAHTQRRPGFDAKNRFGLPFTFPFSYQDYQQAKASSAPDNPKIIREEILGMLAEIPDQAIKDWVSTTLQKDLPSSYLLEMRNKLLTKLEGNPNEPKRTGE